jgi:hypothetical protein
MYGKAEILIKEVRPRKPERKRPLERPRHKWEFIKMDLIQGEKMYIGFIRPRI